MAKNDISDSQLKRGIDLSERYKYLLEQETIIKNMMSLIKTELIEIIQLTNEKKINGIKLIEKNTVDTVSVNNVKKLFNENYGVLDGEPRERTFVDSVVVTIDVDKTLENLRYLNGIQEPLIKKIKYQLDELIIKKEFDLEVLKQ